MPNEPLSPRGQQMFALLEKYRAGNLTQKQFCAQENISMSTFLYWYKRCRRDAGATPVADAFIPIAVTATNSPAETAPTCSVEYPNGVVVRLFGAVNTSLLAELVRLGAA